MDFSLQTLGGVGDVPNYSTDNGGIVSSLENLGVNLAAAAGTVGIQALGSKLGVSGYYTNPAAIARLYDTWRDADADAQQKRLDEIRGTFAKYPMIPALKAAIAHWSGLPEWGTVRPPLVALTTDQAAALVSDLKARHFDMPGLAR